MVEQAAPVRGHDERLLLVEDQQELREALSRVLQDAGYHVVVAGDGEQALDLALEPGAEFDLVVSDVVMPRMSGLDLAEHLAAAKPRIKVLLISGHMSHPSLARPRRAARRRPPREAVRAGRPHGEGSRDPRRSGP